MRINGIGTTYLGFTAKDDMDRCYATVWVTFLYAPIAPLGRHYLQLLPHTGSGFSCKAISTTPLNGAEVLRTYLFGWIVFPLVLFGPFIPAFREVQEALGLPESWQMPLIVIAIVWLAVGVWKLADWHEERGHPRKKAEPPAKRDT